MALTDSESALITLAIQQVPSIIDAIKSIFASQNPGAPTPTDAQVIAAFNSAFASSLAVDDAYLAVHPAS